jgi:hypothetical protein
VDSHLVCGHCSSYGEKVKNGFKWQGHSIRELPNINFFTTKMVFGFFAPKKGHLTESLLFAHLLLASAICRQ